MNARQPEPRVPGGSRRAPGEHDDPAAEAAIERAVGSARSCAAMRDRIAERALTKGAHTDDDAEFAAHAASCADCADEVRFAASLVAAERSLPRPAVPAEGLARILEAVRAEGAAASTTAASTTGASTTAAAEAPKPAGRIARPRWWAVAFPLAAAAAVLVAILASRPRDAVEARLCAKSPMRLVPASGGGARSVEPAAPDFAFREGDVVEAGAELCAIKLAHDGTPSEGLLAGLGELHLKLAPGASVARTGPFGVRLIRGFAWISSPGGIDGFTLERAPAADLASAVFRIRGDGRVEAEAEVIGDRLLVMNVTGKSTLSFHRSGDAPETRDLELSDGLCAIAGPHGGLAVPRITPRTADTLLLPEIAVAAVEDASGPCVEVRIAPGAAGPVTVPGFDDSHQRFAVTVTPQAEGAARWTAGMKVLRSMCVADPGSSPTVRLAADRPWTFRIRVPAAEELRIVPGPAEVTVEFAAYAGNEWHGDVASTVESSSGAEWRGTVRSLPVVIDIPPR